MRFAICLLTRLLSWDLGIGDLGRSQISDLLPQANRLKYKAHLSTNSTLKELQRFADIFS